MPPWHTYPRKRKQEQHEQRAQKDVQTERVMVRLNQQRRSVTQVDLPHLLSLRPAPQTKGLVSFLGLLMSASHGSSSAHALPVGWFRDCCTDPVESTLCIRAELHQLHREMLELMLSCPPLSQERESLRQTEENVSTVWKAEIMAALTLHWPLAYPHDICFISG